MGNVKRAIRRCVANHLVSEKKSVVSAIRQREDGKDYMAGQNGKVQPARRAEAGKNRVVVHCVHDVADEKNGREREDQHPAFAS